MYASIVVDYLWKVSWQTAIVAGIVWIVTRLCQKAPASWRYGLWLLVLLKFCMPPLVHLPSNAVFVSSERPSTVSAPQPNAITAQPTTISGSEPMGMAQSAESTPITGHKLPLVDFWLLGLIVFGIVLIARLYKQSHLIRTSEELKDNAIDGLLIDCASKIGVRNIPRIKISAKITTPMLVGSIRPCILLPMGMDYNEDFRAMLLHELSHIKRLDILTVWLYELVKLAFYFHPALWFAGHELKKERELACDEKVLAISGIDRKDYASGYVSALKMANSAVKMPLALGMAEPFEVEKRRLERILHRPIPKYTWAWALGILIIGIIMLPTVAGIVKKDPNVLSSVPEFDTSDKPVITKKVELSSPVVWSKNGIRVEVAAIGRAVDETPQDYLVLFVKLVDPSQKFYDIGLPSIMIGNSLIDMQHSTLKDDFILLYYPMPSKSGNKINVLDGELSSNPMPDDADLGPYPINRMKKPLVFDNGRAVVKMADIKVVEPPATYLSGGAAGNNEDIGPWFKDRSSGLYLMMRSYSVEQHSRWSAEPTAFIAQDRNGVSVRLSETVRGLDNDNPYYGLQYVQITSKMKREQGYRDGLLVVAVDPNGPAAQAKFLGAEPTISADSVGNGVKPGDIITEFNGETGEELFCVSGNSLDSKSITVIRKIGKIAYRLRFTLTPVEDPLFVGMNPGHVNPWGDMMAYYKGHRAKISLFSHIYMSYEPVPQDYKPVSLIIKTTVGGQEVKKIGFKLKDIPIPSEIWDK